MKPSRPALQVFKNCWKIVNQPLGTNTYILISEDEHQALVIDPGFFGEMTLDFLKEHELQLRAILCTHGHFDHIASVEALRLAHSAECYLHTNDVKVVKTANFLMMACKIPGKIVAPSFGSLISGAEQTVQFAGFPDISWLNIPGHTPGSCALVLTSDLGPKLVFTGDSLYSDTVSLVSLPGENPPLLAQSVSRLLSGLEDSAQVFPGHGRHSTIGDILKNNKALKEFLEAHGQAISRFS